MDLQANQEIKPLTIDSIDKTKPKELYKVSNLPIFSIYKSHKLGRDNNYDIQLFSNGFLELTYTDSQEKLTKRLNNDQLDQLKLSVKNFEVENWKNHIDCEKNLNEFGYTTVKIQYENGIFQKEFVCLLPDELLKVEYRLLGLLKDNK